MIGIARVSSIISYSNAAFSMFYMSCHILFQSCMFISRREEVDANTTW